MALHRFARPARRFTITVAALFALAAACRGESDEPPRTLTIHNETDCVVRIRFDNGVNVGLVNPRASAEYRDERLDEYRYLKLESTMAIFRTFDMAEIRDAGWSVTVRPAVEDGDCVDLPPGG
ncbi:MAG TPA: hypothetical protein VIH21_03705 [Dehalococcoidia bacterium]|jgi:hypothetical protein